MEAQRMKKNSYKDDNFEFKQKLEYIKKAVDYHYLLTSLGFELERDSAKEYRGACIIHGGDNKTAFRFNKELGTWVCFTIKCHESFLNKSNIVFKLQHQFTSTKWTCIFSVKKMTTIPGLLEEHCIYL